MWRRRLGDESSPGRDNVALGLIRTDSVGTLHDRLELAPLDVALHMDHCLLRRDLRHGAALQKPEGGNRLELERTRSERLEVVEGCN